MSKRYCRSPNAATIVTRTMIGARYVVGIRTMRDMYLASGRMVKIMKTYETAMDTNTPYAMPGLVVKRRGPITMPWYWSTIIMTAAVLPPGTPSAIIGTSVPDVTPLLAASGAITPSGVPVP